MASKSLPPGFRFHPTDVELVLYYLKRKVMGKKLHYEAIAEVNIYKFSPWDLPDKSCLKSKDLEWFFFCPREKKYASGVRVKRATEKGYWKTTGKDRNVRCNEKTVGTVKTLVFHLGHAPHGERTDWVIHEYRILDDQLAAAGIQDMYVLCKVFKKNGPGPKNGAQYGAPFNEADWDDDDVDDAHNEAISLEFDGPSAQMQTREQSVPLESGFLRPGDTSGLPLLGEDPFPSAGGLTSEVVMGETNDEISYLLAAFTDEGPFTDEGMTFNDIGINQGDLSGNGKTEDDLSGDGKNELLPCSDRNDIFSGLDDLDIWSQMNEGALDFSEFLNDEYFRDNMPSQDNSTYLELDDLLRPLHFSHGVSATDQSSPREILGSQSHENMQQSDTGASFAGMGQYASCVNELPVAPEGSHDGDGWFDVMVDHVITQGSDASYDLEFTYGQRENVGQLENLRSPADDMERGSHIEKCYSRLMECNPARLPSAAEHLALSFSPCGGSSIHIKAEVTHGAGECTNEALSVMMGGSGSCWCNLPCAVFTNLQLWFVNRLLYLVGFGFSLILVYCYLNETYMEFLLLSSK